MEGVIAQAGEQVDYALGRQGLERTPGRLAVDLVLLGQGLQLQRLSAGLDLAVLDLGAEIVRKGPIPRDLQQPQHGGSPRSRAWWPEGRSLCPSLSTSKSTGGHRPRPSLRSARRRAGRLPPPDRYGACPAAGRRPMYPSSHHPCVFCDGYVVSDHNKNDHECLVHLVHQVHAKRQQVTRED